MTIYDISEKAGVSIATVSRVLNGSSNVKPETKQKVLDVIEKYNYTPNAFARGLGLDTMNSIGIICADSSDLYLAKAVYYIERELRKSGYSVLLACSGYELEGRIASVNMLLEKKVDCIILVGSSYVTLEGDTADPEDNQSGNSDPNSYIREAASHVPVMLMNAYLDCPNVYSILCDDYNSMKNLTMSLIDRGISDILYFYDSKTFSGYNKIAGFRAAMKEVGISDCKDRELLYTGDNRDIEAITDFLTQNITVRRHLYRAVISADDTLAVGVLKYAKYAEIAVPDDMCITGYNNSIISSCCEPELTTVDNHLDNLCLVLVKTCMAVLNNETVDNRNVFSGQIIIRGTT